MKCMRAAFVSGEDVGLLLRPVARHPPYSGVQVPRRHHLASLRPSRQLPVRPNAASAECTGEGM